jgi:cardiolipin synthase
MAGCATLPDTEVVKEHRAAQAARFENAFGQLSAKRSDALVAKLKRTSGDVDMLDKQIALEQDIVGSPLVVGNKVTLLQDGPATYEAMFAAIRTAKDHINMESYIIEDDEVGRQLADLLLERRPGARIQPGRDEAMDAQQSRSPQAAGGGWAHGIPWRHQHQ